MHFARNQFGMPASQHLNWLFAVVFRILSRNNVFFLLLISLAFSPHRCSPVKLQRTIMCFGAILNTPKKRLYNITSSTCDRIICMWTAETHTLYREINNEKEIKNTENSGIGISFESDHYIMRLALSFCHIAFDFALCCFHYYVSESQ